MSDSDEIQQGYRVMVDDNFHYMDERYRECAGTFKNYEDALKIARRITIRSVDKNLGMSPSETIEKYKAFGEDPFIQPFGGAPPPEEMYSAWTIAEMLAQLIEDEPDNELVRLIKGEAS